MSDRLFELVAIKSRDRRGRYFTTGYEILNEHTDESSPVVIPKTVTFRTLQMLVDWLNVQVAAQEANHDA